MSGPDRQPVSGAGPLCAVIIPTYNGAALTGACLEALLANPPQHCRWRIIVVDDGSTDDTAEVLHGFAGWITPIPLAVNSGFAAACNAGAGAASDSDFLVFLNNDTVPVAGWLDALVAEALDDPGIAAVGARLLFPGGQVQHAGVVIGQDRIPHHLYAGFDGEHPAVTRARDVTAVTAACMLIRREDFERPGGFDAAFHNGYEDVDLCLKLTRAGRRIRYCPTSVVYHLESVTRWPQGVPQGIEQSERVYRERWLDAVVPDDVQHYLDDGLLQVAYDTHYPLRLTVAPELATASGSGGTDSALQELLAKRSRQVMELTSDAVRDWKRQLSPAAPPRTLAAPEVPAEVRVLGPGRRRELGTRKARRAVSVLLPVKDGAPHLRRLLPAILAQSADAELEIIAVDSGSRDDSVNVLQEYGATVLSIDPAHFNHGLTRNLAAERAGGEVLVLLSQRSRPVGDRWLAALLSVLAGDPQVAGVCSRVTPYPDSDILTRRDVERDLSASTQRRRTQIEDPGAYRALPPDQRRALLNFHTVSAAIRAEAWRRIPFRAVRTLGEDLLWAREALEAGWALVHEPASVVQHTHAYTVEELFARNVDDGIANREIVQRTMERAAVLPATRALIEDDWHYLRHTLGLRGSELERWQLEAALRRTAQISGQWLGLNDPDLPAGTAAAFSSLAARRAG